MCARTSISTTGKVTVARALGESIADGALKAAVRRWGDDASHIIVTPKMSV